ncbi:alpha/beta-hydrolase [Terfezia boudieri ATCC MYA-4762]|uniref:Alpha/beta-hydrolase n=1 Tax=Terfezia boudieri ATCC MYA-4762 TaxID=1051890 RepID=A0A3N4M350_9PEZI|nr:alpha/beta-hydrolase [Terfezia boudieri ATCC MYA-4762]
MSEIDPPPYTESPAPRMGDHCTSNSRLDPSIQPTGEIIRLGGNECYISKPVDLNMARILIFLCNGAGIHSPMNQAHADKFASEGFLVFMPDLTPAFSKEEIGKLPLIERPKMATFMIELWLARHTEEKTMPIIEKVVKALKEVYPENTANGVYTIGYCFGGKYVLKLAATGDIKAGALAHGTLVTLKDIKEVRQPVSFACVEGDPFFPDEVRDNGRRYLEDMKVPSEFKLYRGVPHGEFKVSSYVRQFRTHI